MCWRRPGSWLLEGLVIAFLVTMTGSSRAESVGEVRQAVVGGQSVPDTQFAAVGALVRDVAASSRFVCTATLIAPRLLLTAAHCLVDPGGLAFVRGSDPLASDAERVPVSRVRVHPGFAISGVDVENDIAVATLAEPVSGVEPVALGDAVPRPGDAVTLVGYGASSAEEGRRADAEPSRNAAPSSVDAVSEFRLVIGSGEEAENCTGDSGGPALAEDGHDQRVLRVIGVVSSAVHADSPCEGGTVHMRVDAYASFITEAATANSSREPGSCALNPRARKASWNDTAPVVALSLALLRRRARRARRA